MQPMEVHTGGWFGVRGLKKAVRRRVQVSPEGYEGATRRILLLEDLGYHPKFSGSFLGCVPARKNNNNNNKGTSMKDGKQGGEAGQRAPNAQEREARAGATHIGVLPSPSQHRSMRPQVIFWISSSRTFSSPIKTSWISSIKLSTPSVHFLKKIALDIRL